jgi:hypothetical protein
MKKITSIVAIAGIALLSACQTKQVDTTTATTAAANQHVIDSLKTELVRQQVIDSMAAVAKAETPKTVTTHVVYTPAKKKTTTRRSSASANTVNSYAGYSQPAPVYNEPVAPVQQPQKKGWSAKAKGAVIGAGVGAAAGAIINKRNRGVGAIIGGVLGAGAGTGVGAIIDKKHGR